MDRIWYAPQDACKSAAEYANKETSLEPTEFDAAIVNGHVLAVQNGVNLDSWCMHTRPCQKQCMRWALLAIQWLRDNKYISS